MTRQSIIPLSYTKCNTIDAAWRRHFLFSPLEFFQTKRRPPHPWCVDGVDTPGWGLVQPQAERFASTLGGRRAVMVSHFSPSFLSLFCVRLLRRIMYYLVVTFRVTIDRVNTHDFASDFLLPSSKAPGCSNQATFLQDGGYPHLFNTFLKCFRPKTTSFSCNCFPVLPIII